MPTVRMPPILRQAVGGAREVDAEGTSVREILDDLTSRFPAIRGHLLDDAGDLNRFVNVYVNNEDVRLGQGLDTSVGADSTVVVAARTDVEVSLEFLANVCVPARFAFLPDVSGDLEPIAAGLTRFLFLSEPCHGRKV